MPTRKQNPETRTFREDAFASSVEYDRGIAANLVANRCEKLADKDAIKVIWWLQQISWRDGGIEKFASDFLARNQALIGTASMHVYGQRPGQIYNADQVRKVRSELGGNRSGRENYPLKGETRMRDLTALMSRSWESEYGDDFTSDKPTYPTSYPAQRFRDDCDIDDGKLSEHLKHLMVDPATRPSAGLWNMPGLWAALIAWRDAEIEAEKGRIVDTVVTAQISNELDYALEARTFILIEGREGIGKSEGARNWCARHPGQSVYVRLESGSDETTLYRSIARALGTTCSYCRKALEMRAKIQDALQSGQLLLVLDEAHFLWPQSERAFRSAPKRIDWLRTALVDFNVPVALISTPQYFDKACTRFREGGWNSIQIQRRLARTSILPEPDAIPVEDVLAVASRYFPRSDKRTLKQITAVALGTVGFLANIKFLRQRVDFLAKRRPAAAEAELIAEGLHENGLRSPQTPPADAPSATLKEDSRTPQRTLNAPVSTPRAGSGRLIIQPEAITV